jgi:UDP-galactose transporter B1
MSVKMVRIKLTLTIAAMLFAFWVHYALQETLVHKNPGPNDFPFPDFLQTLCNLFNFLSAVLVIWFRRIPWRYSPFRYMGVSIPQRLGITCLTYSQLFLGYPTVQLFKSAKPIAIMIAQVVMTRRFPAMKRVIVVVVLSIGLGIFGFGGKLEKGSAWGFALAFAALFFDAIYVPIVDGLKVSGGPFVVLLYAQMWSFLIFAGGRPLETIAAVQWIARHPKVIGHLSLYAGTGAIGQVVLFFALEMTDGLVVAIATTFRKFVTILLSAVLFRHQLGTAQWVGVVVVFAALALENLWSGKKKKAEPQEKESQQKESQQNESQQKESQQAEVEDPKTK